MQRWRTDGEQDNRWPKRLFHAHTLQGVMDEKDRRLTWLDYNPARKGSFR